MGHPAVPLHDPGSHQHRQRYGHRQALGRASLTRRPTRRPSSRSYTARWATTRSAPHAHPICAGCRRASPVGSAAPPVPIPHPCGQAGSAGPANPPSVDALPSTPFPTLAKCPRGAEISPGRPKSVEFQYVRAASFLWTALQRPKKHVNARKHDCCVLGRVNRTSGRLCVSGAAGEDSDLRQARYLWPSRRPFFRRPTRLRGSALLLQRQD